MSVCQLFCFVVIQVGYEIVRINGLTLSEVTHEEAVNLLKIKKTMTVVVKGAIERVTDND